MTGDEAAVRFVKRYSGNVAINVVETLVEIVRMTRPVDAGPQSRVAIVEAMAAQRQRRLEQAAALLTSTDSGARPDLSDEEVEKLEAIRATYSISDQPAAGA